MARRKKEKIFKDPEGTRTASFERERSAELSQEASDAIAEKEAILNAVFDSTLDGMFLFDLRGRYVDVNPAGCRMFGYSREELLASDVSLLLFPEDRDAAFERGARSWKNGGFVPASRMRRKDGSEVWVELTITPIRVGDASYALGIKRDITEKKRAIEDLESSVEERTAELRDLNEKLQAEVRQRERTEGILRSIVEATSSYGGTDFLRLLVRNLAETLDFKYAFVGLVTGEDHDRVRTMALWAGGEFADDFEYALADTPCDDVVNNRVCFYRDNVQDLFPEDYLLKEMGIICYLGVPLLDSRGEVRGILVALDDKPKGDELDYCSIFGVFVSRAAFELEREALEKERDETAGTLQAIMDNTNAFIYLKDPEGRLVFINRKHEELLGKGGCEIIGRKEEDIFPAEVVRQFRENDSVVLERNEPVEFEEEIPGPDGTVHTYMAVKFPIPTMPGYVCGISTDITERKEAAEELARSEAMLREAQRIARIGSWEWDPAEDRARHSGKLHTLFGMPEKSDSETLEGFMKAVHPEDRELFRKTMDDSISSGRPFSLEYRMVTTDGEVRIVSDQAEVVIGEDGRPERITGTIQDITERKLAEEKLRKSEQRFRRLIESLPVGVALADEEGNVLDVNPAAMKIVGCGTREEFTSRNISEYYKDPGQRKRFLEILKRDGHVSDYEVTVLTADGEERLVSVSSHIFDGEDGRRLFLSISRDVTETKRTEEELLRAQKIETIGNLAGKIAHDFNNIMLGVVGKASIAKEHARGDERVFRLLGEIEEAALKAKGMTKQLLTFSRGGTPVKEAVSIGPFLQNTASLFLNGSGTGCALRVPDDVWDMVVDEGQVAQVMNNLVLNASQAMDGAGRVEVGASNVEVEKGSSLPLEPGKYVRISVRDRGTGIPKKELSRVFEPFYTTKERASGLGLTVSFSVVKKHGGHIEVESTRGRGSTFNVYLPAREKGADMNGAAEGLTRGTGKILVMDDEELVRDVSGEMLELLGYEAEFASDGHQAIEMYREAMDSGSPYRAVIMDLTIPGGIGGKEAVEELLKIDPGLIAIVSSGYSRDPVMSDCEKFGFKGVITKPYRVADFGKVIRKVLEGKG